MPSGTTQLADLVPGAPRARRQEPPVPRKPQPTLAAVSLTTTADPPVDAPVAPTPGMRPSVAAHVAAPPVEMRALGQRIREPFYSQLTAIVYELDRRRIRTNKTEVLEYLLAGLPDDEAGLEALASRIAAFRARHPRAT